MNTILYNLTFGNTVEPPDVIIIVVVTHETEHRYPLMRGYKCGAQMEKSSRSTNGSCPASVSRGLTVLRTRLGLSG